MKVTLINYTREAVETLLFTKNTRLNMTAANFHNTRMMTDGDKAAQLAYMANTIPSSWEFVDYTFSIEGVSRAFTHQFVRNRLGSYAQQSMRVTDQSEFGFVMPSVSYNANLIIGDVVDYIHRAYSALKREGVADEDARSILPTNVSTNIVAKYNLRAMATLAKSRTGGRTQGEFQRVVNAMIDEVLRVHPWAEKFLFGDCVDRDYFAEIEAFALDKFPDLKERGELLKIVDKMRAKFFSDKKESK